MKGNGFPAWFGLLFTTNYHLREVVNYHRKFIIPCDLVWSVGFFCRLSHTRNINSTERSLTPKKPKPWRTKSLWRRSSSVVCLQTLLRRKSESTSVPLERYIYLRLRHLSFSYNLELCLIGHSFWSVVSRLEHNHNTCHVIFYLCWAVGVSWTSHGEQNQQKKRLLLHHIQRGGTS